MGIDSGELAAQKVHSQELEITAALTSTPSCCLGFSIFFLSYHEVDQGTVDCMKSMSLVAGRVPKTQFMFRDGWFRLMGLGFVALISSVLAPIF